MEPPFHRVVVISHASHFMQHRVHPMSPEHQETLILLETNLDDMPAEWIGPLLDLLLDEGALDAWLTPIHMKKNRPAVQLSVLCSPDRAKTLRMMIFTHTSTLGIRQQEIQRYFLPRHIEKVITRFGPIRMKVAEYGPGKWKAAPEFEDCLLAAQTHQTPLREVYGAALRAWSQTQKNEESSS